MVKKIATVAMNTTTATPTYTAVTPINMVGPSALLGSWAVQLGGKLVDYFGPRLVGGMSANAVSAPSNVGNSGS